MKKGFTLVELLSVIVILGILASIAIPTINTAINSSRNKAYNEQINTIQNAARTYMSKNSLKLPNQEENAKCTISVTTLQKEGLLSVDDIANPKYKKNSSKPEEKFKNFDGKVIVTFTNNKYKYEYVISSSVPNC